MKTYKIHPFATAFPYMSDEEVKALSEDIKTNGQIHPIIVMGDVLLDGRHRLRACQMAEIDPAVKEYEGLTDDESLLKYITSLNIHRRHLTTSQKAFAGMKMMVALSAGAKERQRLSGGNHGNQYTKMAVVPTLEQPANEETDQLVPMLEQAGRDEEHTDNIDDLPEPPPPPMEKGRAIELAAKAVGVSNELFRFYSDTTTKETKLEVGELENPLGVLAFRKSSDFGIPPFKITITSQAGRWYVSFSFGFLPEIEGEGDKEDKLAKNKRQQALLDRLYTKGMGELENIALGVDGCLPVMDSDGVKYDLEPGATRNLEVRERRLRRYKKKIKRMQQGSNRSKRLQAKIDRLAQYRTNVLNDYANKVSTKLANHPAKILVFEKTDTSSINWRRPQGHSRTKTKITVLTKSKAWKNKLVVVLHPRQPACSPCGAHAPDPVDLRRRAAFSIAHRRYSVQTKKRDEAYREPLLKEAQIVHVGHVEVKCETEYDLTHVRKYLRMLEMLKGVGEPATPEELVRTILWGSREASREAVHNLCLWFKDSDRDDKDVAISKIRRWPHELGFATFTAKLFKKNGIL